MFRHIVRPRPRLALVDDMFMNVVNDSMKKCSRANGWIEYQNLMAFPDLLPSRFPFFIFDRSIDWHFGSIRQTILQSEILLEDMINALDDVGNNRFRSIVNAPRFALLGIIFSKEGLVKMDDRIFAAGALTEIR